MSGRNNFSEQTKLNHFAPNRLTRNDYFELYVKQDKSQLEIAELLGVDQSTVSRHLAQLDIDTSDKYKPNRAGVRYRTSVQGYERWQEASGTGSNNVLHIHRLAAVAWFGFEEFDDDTVVHHQNEIKWDNREENLTLMSNSEHIRYHMTQTEGDR